MEELYINIDELDKELVKDNIDKKKKLEIDDNQSIKSNNKTKNKAKNKAKNKGSLVNIID